MKLKLTLLAILIATASYIGWRQTDLSCQNDCLRMGYSYSYCHTICSYENGE